MLFFEIIIFINVRQSNQTQNIVFDLRNVFLKNDFLYIFFKYSKLQRNYERNRNLGQNYNDCLCFRYILYFLILKKTENMFFLIIF